MIRDGKCLSCGTEVDKTLYNMGKAIDESYGWWSWAREPEGRRIVVPGYGEVTMVAKSVNAHAEEGESWQEVFMIFEVGGAFYRKNGHGDSYGSVEWDDAFVKVAAKEKTVLVYE